MQISIAVVIPLYNKRPHIARTLDSVLAQRTQPAEIIVVDDGSTDGSVDAVLPYQHFGVQVISQRNSGVSMARNRGMAAATSTWIAFLDADDLWLPNHIELLARAIEAYPDVGLISTQHKIIELGLTFRPRFAYPKGVAYRVDNFFKRFAVGLSLVNSSTACVRREAAIALGGFPVNIHIGEDIVLWVKIADYCGMAHAGEVSAVIRRDSVNRSTAIVSTKLGSLTYLGELLKQVDVSTERRKSIGILFDRIAFFTAAGRKLQGDIATVLNIQRACWASKRVGAWLAVSLLLFTPIKILEMARRRRHATE